jgi:hypothetical protein
VNALRSLVVGSTLALSGFATGCKGGPPPQRVKLELPELIVSSDAVRAIVRVTEEGTSPGVSNEAHSFTLVPPDLADITPDGTLICKKSGDGKLSVDVRSVKADAKLSCRLVAKLEVVDLPVFDVSKGPVALNAKALDKSGKELSEVPIKITPSNPRPLAVNGTMLTPVAVGETDLAIRSGSAEHKVSVRVVKTLDLEALPLQGGKRVNFSLDEGEYEVEVNLTADKPFAIEWRGAPYCNYKGTGKTHKSRCVLQRKGGAVVDNPAFVESGSTEIDKSRIAVRAVP